MGVIQGVRLLGAYEKGKRSLSASADSYRANLQTYTGLVEKIKTTSKERKSLLAEKKDTSMFDLSKHKELSKRIAELTETLEELRTEKVMLLGRFQFLEDATADTLKKEIRTLEDGLKKLEASEAKYAAELDNALKQYAELQEQAAEFDPVELYKARQAICPEQEQLTAEKVQDAYGDKYDMLRMYDSKRAVSNLLNEPAEEQAARKLQRMLGNAKKLGHRKPKHYKQER